MKKNHLYRELIFFLLLGCAYTNTLQVQNNITEFQPAKKIYVEAGSEVVPLSSDLKKRLNMARFNTTDSRKDADYILTFDYSARFDVYPWVFRSFNIVMTAPDTGRVAYKIVIDDMKPEPVHILMTRAVDDMASRLLGPDRKGKALILKTKE